MKVYVSSTFEDLREHRRAVSVAIRKAGWEDVAMEYYGAENKRAVDRCLEDVADCDLYIGLFAWRYGWVPPKSKFSITEMEYRKAVSLDKPRLLFLADPNAGWPPLFVDANRRKIEALRKRVSEDRVASFFSSADSLIGQLAPALSKRIEVKPAVAPGIDTEAYFRYLRRRYGIVDLDALMDPKRDELQPLRLENIFIEQSVKEDSPPLELTKDMVEVLRNREEVHKDDLPEGMTAEVMSELRQSYLSKPSLPVLDVLAAEENRWAIVLGDPGAGKSTLIRYLLLSLSDPAPPAKLSPAPIGRLPILIDLKSYTALRGRNQCRTLFDYFDRMNAEDACPLTGAMLHRHLDEKQPAVMLFDGIDEIFEPEEQEKITNQIIGIAEAYPHVRIVATSRIIGYRRALLTNAGFKHYTLQDLDRNAVTTFTRRWYELTLTDAKEVDSHVERITSAYRDSPSIRQLAGNPMLLTIMAIIGKHQELPRARWSLYDHAAGVLVQHWDVKKHLAAQQLGADLMDDEDKKELLRQLAYAMQKGQGGLAGNYIHGTALQQLVEEHLRRRYQMPAEQTVKIARAMIAQFRTRNFILASYGANLYGFVHRAFLEFFCASAIVHRFEKTRDLPFSELAETFEAHRKEKAWNEVLRLICGAIGESFAGDLIDQLRKTGDPNAIKLAVECLSEVRRIDAIGGVAGQLLIAALDCLAADELVDGQELAEAAAAIGPRWPERDRLVAWLSHVKEIDYSELVADALAYTLGSIGDGLEDLKSLLMNLADQVLDPRAIAAIYALGVGWRDDPDVTEFLIHCAEANRPDHEVALYSLAFHRLADARVVDVIFKEAAARAGGAAERIVILHLNEDRRSVPILMKATKNSFAHYAVHRLERHIAEPGVRALLQKLVSDKKLGPGAAEILARHPAPPKKKRARA